MTAKEFQELVAPWQGRFIELSAKLEISVTQIDAYRSGTCQIPKQVADKVKNIGYPPLSNGQKIVCQYFVPASPTDISSEKAKKKHKSNKRIITDDRWDNRGMDDRPFLDFICNFCLLILFLFFFVPIILCHVGCLLFGGKR